MSFPARYPGRCGACDEAIRVDDECIYTADVLVHANCEEAAPTEPVYEICQTCWIAKAANGECGCT